MIYRSIKIHDGTQMLDVADDGKSIEFSINDIEEHTDKMTFGDSILILTKEQAHDLMRILKETLE